MIIYIKTLHFKPVYQANKKHVFDY
ncbi:Protein of unknown function [Bacillus cereus]|nr:Protein of unknown function [Bacillus cereus]